MSRVGHLAKIGNQQAVGVGRSTGQRFAAACCGCRRRWLGDAWVDVKQLAAHAFVHFMHRSGSCQMRSTTVDSAERCDGGGDGAGHSD